MHLIARRDVDRKGTDLQMNFCMKLALALSRLQLFVSISRCNGAPMKDQRSPYNVLFIVTKNPLFPFISILVSRTKVNPSLTASY